MKDNQTKGNQTKTNQNNNQTTTDTVSSKTTSSSSNNTATTNETTTVKNQKKPVTKNVKATNKTTAKATIAKVQKVSENCQKDASNLYNSVNENAKNLFDCATILGKTTETVASDLTKSTNKFYDDSLNILQKSFKCFSPEQYINLQEKWFFLCSDSAVRNFVNLSNGFFRCSNDIQKPLDNIAKNNIDSINKSVMK